jgi:hypothetical protein
VHPKVALLARGESQYPKNCLKVIYNHGLLRNLAAGQSYKAQYQFGIEVLDKYGVNLP